MSYSTKVDRSYTFDQRGKRLRESLSTFITLHKARVLYYWEVAANTKLFKDSSLGNAVFIFEGIGYKI